MRDKARVHGAKVAGAYSVCAVVWGTTWFAIRVSMAPGAYATYEAAALRFSLAVAIIGVLALCGRVRPKRQGRRQLLWLCAAGLINALCYGLVYAGEERVPGSVASVLFASLPLITGMLALLTRTEPIFTGQVIGSLIALAGITAIFWDRLNASRQQGLGVIMVFGAVVANAVYMLILKRKTQDIHSLAATGVFLAATSVGLWGFSLAGGWRPLPWPIPVRPTIAILYLSVVGSIVVFGCYIYLLKHVSLMTVSTLAMVETLIALVVDRLWEHEIRLVGRSYAAAAITLCGVLVSLLLKPKQVGRTGMISVQTGH